MVATALSMVAMYIVVAVAYYARVGDAAFDAFDGGATGVGNYIMQSVTQGLQFGISVAVILFGVRTILGELVPAFQGIANRVVPGAVPALDCPIVFPYAQNAVLIGFLASFTGGLIGLLLLGTVFGPAFGLALILPGLVPHFFTGGAALLHRWCRGCVWQCDGWSPGCDRWWFCQWPVGDVPSGSVVEGVGRVWFGEHHFR